MALTLSSSSSQSSSLFASIDIGTNSFKLLIVRTDPSGRFFPIHRTKHRVLLGRDVTPTLTPYSISPHSTIRALEALSDFHNILQSHHVAQTQTRCVATAAVRDAHNTLDFVNSISNNIGMKVDVLSGEEEARLGYLGVLQFLPVYDKLALTVDIGGGSTEFVVGFKGKSVFATSLNLGHVVLTQRFTNKDAVPRMREHIRSVIHESGVVERIQKHGFEIAVGSSGTIKAIDNAVFRGVVDGGKRGWGFSRGELRGVVEMLCDGEREKEKERVFEERSEFIVAGAVLLEEIFEMLGVEEMKVSGYSLGEGVIAESLAKLYPGYYDLNANVRWQSVMRFAMRFNGQKKMRSAVECAILAKDIFQGLRNYKDQARRNKVELASVLIENDLEYLEAASLLHNIGLVTGKKGYHKQSYHFIMNGGHLCDYSPDEVKLIALLTRHHRKKFPKSDAFMENHEEENQKFIYLCAIIRISVALQHHDALKSQESSDVKNHHLPTIIQRIVDNIIPELREETHNFKTVFEL
ncbi:PREDICTED: uncharacterized protein LOC109336772 isoform X1 [Lupinus angustifolius]|uniref:uncharacterized protein LOC109336772 isoform X1 n=1 Tax=Lupinus angustifolius TaxID=3871 RepID=UPI00092EBD60|nr:PREDICTED: uncharacterized protein LOC109336772 isoform X1 [Lupinus angustifolius]